MLKKIISFLFGKKKEAPQVEEVLLVIEAPKPPKKKKAGTKAKPKKDATK